MAMVLKSEHDMTNEHPIFSKCMAAVTTKKIDRSYCLRSSLDVYVHVHVYIELNVDSICQLLPPSHPSITDVT